MTNDVVPHNLIHVHTRVEYNTTDMTEKMVVHTREKKKKGSTETMSFSIKNSFTKRKNLATIKLRRLFSLLVVRLKNAFLPMSSLINVDNGIYSSSKKWKRGHGINFRTANIKSTRFSHLSSLVWKQTRRKTPFADIWLEMTSIRCTYRHRQAWEQVSSRADALFF